MCLNLSFNDVSLVGCCDLVFLFIKKENDFCYFKVLVLVCK